MTNAQAVGGLLDDLERVVRPVDAQGNRLPMATISVGVETPALVKMALAAVLVGVATGAINRKVFGGKK